MDQFLSNPILNETDVIKVNVIFKKIEVEGNIIIENNFNKANFNDTLQDLVYKVSSVNYVKQLFINNTLYELNS